MRKTAGFDESPSVKYSSCRPSASLIEEGADAISRARSAEKGVLYAATLMVSPGMSSPGVTFGMATTPEMNGLLPATRGAVNTTPPGPEVWERSLGRSVGAVRGY